MQGNEHIHHHRKRACDCDGVNINKSHVGEISCIALYFTIQRGFLLLKAEGWTYIQAQYLKIKFGSEKS